MSPEIAITYAEAKADEVRVGNHGANRTDDPDPHGHSGFCESGADSQRRDHV